MARLIRKGQVLTGTSLKVLSMTWDEYQADKEALDRYDGIIEITDKDCEDIDADDIAYSDTTTVKGAIDEINSNLSDKQNQLTFIIGYGQNNQVSHQSSFCSINLPKGTYILLGYIHSNGAWLNGITDTNDSGYLMLGLNGSFSKIVQVGSNKTFSLVNLSGSSLQNYGSNYICAIKISD